MIIYNNHFRLLASSHNFSRPVMRFMATACNHTQLFHTSALRKRIGASPPAACRLSFPPPRPSGFSSFQTLSFDPQPRNEQRGPRSITVESPGASFLSPVLAPLSLSYTLRLLSYPLVHTQTCAGRMHMLEHTRHARPFYSPRSVPPPARPPLSS